MTVQIPITPELEAKLRARTGGSEALARFVAAAIEERLSALEPESTSNGSRPVSDEEWSAEFRRRLDSHRPLAHEADDSRETNYGRRGE